MFNFHIPSTPTGPPPAWWDGSIPDPSADQRPTFSVSQLQPAPVPNLPPVPGAGGHGKTVVSTEALATFKAIVDAMIEPVNTARSKVLAVNVAPGAFFEADQIRDAVNGAKGVSGQQSDALTALGNGLAALRDGLDTMIRVYKNTEELNNADAKDVGRYLSLAGGYFGQLVPGGGANTNPGSGPDPSSSSTNNGNGN